MRANITTTDYNNIASQILAKGYDTSEAIEVIYETSLYSICIDLNHKIEHKTIEGGDYDEIISVVDFESYCVTGFDCFTIDGDLLKCDFKNEILTNLLNN